MNNELTQHGVLGMTWGVRRYQNPDGSLKEAGRRHLGIKSKNSKTSVKTEAKSSKTKKNTKSKPTTSQKKTETKTKPKSTTTPTSQKKTETKPKPKSQPKRETKQQRETRAFFEVMNKMSTWDLANNTTSTRDLAVKYVADYNMSAEDAIKAAKRAATTNLMWTMGRQLPYKGG